MLCLPFGPSLRGGGRMPFATIEDCARFSLDKAKINYPDNEKAVEKIKQFIKDNIDHTEKWMINEVYKNDWSLARIYAVDENYSVLHEFYAAEKKKAAAKK